MEVFDKNRTNVEKLSNKHVYAKVMVLFLIALSQEYGI